MPLSGKTDFSVPELLPGATHTVTTEVTGVWQWIWMNAKLSLMGVDVNKTDAAGIIMPTATREASTWAVPWALLILLMAAAFVFFYIRFSRMNNERRSQQWLEYTEAEARLRAREETPKSSES
jgi:dihydroorotate dehydrogenase (fumarate)